MPQYDRAMMRPLLKWHSNWLFRDFSLGAFISSQDDGIGSREYYLLFSLGFWQLSIGFIVRAKGADV